MKQFSRDSAAIEECCFCFGTKGRLGIVEAMAETSNRRTDAIALGASEKRECSVVETNSSAARVRELLGPAIAARL